MRNRLLFVITLICPFFVLSSLAFATDCGRVMMLPDGGAKPLCTVKDCTQSSARYIVSTGEILEACKSSDDSWKITDRKFQDSEDDLFFLESNLAPETDNAGRLCFEMDLEAGVEAEFFDEGLQITGNGEYFGEAIEFEGVVRGKVAATASIGGSIRICPTLRQARVVKPSRSSTTRISGPPQRMVVSRVVSVNNVPHNRP